MFTTPCFIRKNTPELRQRLVDLGYNRYPIWMTNWKDDNDVYVYLVIDGIFYKFPSSLLDDKEDNLIDCGDNEDMFIALAALRDDSDYMQWFVTPKTHTNRLHGCFGQVIGMDGHYKEIVGYEWHRHENKDNALTERLNSIIQMEAEDMAFLPHKATAEEIVEHFKKD